MILKRIILLTGLWMAWFAHPLSDSHFVITLASSSDLRDNATGDFDRRALQPTLEEVSWSMAGANPQRTSWVPDGVDPGASDEFGIEWFRPIEAYIGQHVQLVAARDKVYVSTARGVYALNADSGDLAWRFDTEMPIGHSPTIEGDVLYVGGMDRRVYALNADTGSLIWTFAEARGGFSTNPLVVEEKVLLGSRDGYFYALDKNNGSLLWQYPESSQSPLAPILYSAAYQDGRVFFAANDNYAYALDVESGSLIWRSLQLPGDGYQAWWPVVFGDYVAFSGAIPYAETADPGTSSIRDVVDPDDPYYAQMHNFQYDLDYVRTLQRDDVFHQGEVDGTKLGPEFASGSPQDTTGIAWDWGNGKTVLDASKATEYLEDDRLIKVNRSTNKPWRRGVVVLSAADGTEYTFDSDNDGHPEYAPFLTAGTKSGNRYPPLVIPTKNAQGITSDVVYAQNMYVYWGGWSIPQATLTAWQFGTQYLHPVGETWAVDEPFADSAGGSMLYQNLCCDRIGMARDLNTGSQFQFWGYAGNTLESIKLLWDEIEPWMDSLAPGYDLMWSEASMYDYYPRLIGAYGTKNGIYHNHGLQNPIIPYQGRLFVHRSNAVIALGPNPVHVREMAQDETPEQYEQHIRQEYPQFSRPLLGASSPDLELESVIAFDDIQAMLDRQIAKMLQTGHLRPGYYNSTRGLPQFANYYENPGDTLYTLVQAYPHVSDSLRPNLEKYIKQHYRLYFENELSARTGYWIDDPQPYNLGDPDGFGQLQPREWMPLPPEVEQDLRTHRADLFPGVGWIWDYPQHNLYAMWQYAQLFYSGDLEQLGQVYDSAKERLQVNPPDADTLYEHTWAHNAFIAGYIGFLNLQELAGKSQEDAALRSSVQSQLDQLLILRSSDFRKDHPWGTGADGSNPDIDKRSFSLARNFMYLTPELADYLRANAFDKVQEAVDEYSWIAPYWIATRYEASFSEFANDNLYTNHSMFQAKARILKEPQGQLLKYIDVPAFETGDLFYIQSLIAILAIAPDFHLTVTPYVRSIEAGDEVTFIAEVAPTGGFTKTVTISAPSPSPDLAVHLTTTTIDPPGQTTMTVMDLHDPDVLPSGVWYTIWLTATGDGIREVASVNLLVGGSEVFLPVVFRGSPY